MLLDYKISWKYLKRKKSYILRNPFLRMSALRAKRELRRIGGGQEKLYKH